MEAFTKETLNTLAGYKGAACVSIFIPVHRSGVEVNEVFDALALKSTLQRAEKKLSEMGSDQVSIDEILKAGYGLVEDRVFWNNQLDGLAVFLSDGFFKYLKLPFSLKEELIVDTCFYITPLLPLIYNKYFYLLVLSRDDSKLYRADAFELSEIKLGAGSGKEFFEEAIKAGESEDTASLLKGLKEADDALLKEQASFAEPPPLLLAGTDYLVENYRKISRYRNIAPEVLSGNFDLEDKRRLYVQAKEKLSRYFKNNTDRALKTFNDNSATELTSSIPEEVIPAAFSKKVSDLFIQRDEHIWGKFDEATDHSEIHEQPLKDDTCLINKAVIQTIVNGGDVHVLETDSMPANSKIAAFMRY